jgi:hypothetical protein
MDDMAVDHVRMNDAHPRADNLCQSLKASNY